MPTYVEIDRVTVKEVFDNKYKASLAKTAEKAMQAAIKGKLTDKKPKDKNARGYSLSMNVFMPLDEKKGKLSGKCDVLINFWPKHALHAKASGSASTKVDPGKIDKGDVEAVMDAVMDGAVATAVKHMVSTTP
jgi:hypothetical protein